MTPSGTHTTVIVQGKRGKVSAPHVCDLASALRREKAAVGLFITLREPIRPMPQEAATAGCYVPEPFPDQRFPRLQILTIAEILQGKQAQDPRFAPTATFKRARRRQKGADPQQARVLRDALGIELTAVEEFEAE
jgi:hypothetical protein